LQIDQREIELPTSIPEPQPTAWRELFRYPRSLALSVLTSLGCQAGGLGIGLWSTTLLVLLLRIEPAEASYLMIYAGFVALGGRFAFCYLSDAIGRRPSGVLLSFGAALSLVLAGYYRDVFIGGVSVFYLMLFGQRFFWRWRLRRGRALCGGGLAVKTSGKRHGFRFWHRQFW
jgi:hypothetical protein